MTVVNPYEEVPSMDEKATSIIRQAIPEFSGFDIYWTSTIKKISTLAQRKKAIELLRPYATATFADPATRKFFAIATTIGAKDLDVTPIVDELEQYQNTIDPTALEMIARDQSHMMDVVAPTNFEQFNRYLRLEGKALVYGQTLFLCKAIKTKSFRMAPEFQWIKTSRFAKHPDSIYATTFIGKPEKVTWVRDEALKLIDSLSDEDNAAN